MILIFTHSDVFNFYLVSINTHKSKLSSLLTHPRIFFISQKPLLTLWLKGRHAMLVVTLFFSVTSGVTYGTLCQASGHLVIYHECYEFERASFTLNFFFTLHSFLFFQGLPETGSSTLSTSGLYVYLRNKAAAHSNHSSPQNIYIW